MEGNANNVVTLKKKGYNTAVLVLLILFVMIIGGIIYYLLCEDEMVIIKNVGDESDNSKSNSKSLPKSEITGYCSDCGFPLTKNNVFCVGCGKKIILMMKTLIWKKRNVEIINWIKSDLYE